MRKEIIGNSTLYLGDCAEILPTLDKVDAVITDPPYGIKRGSGMGGGGNGLTGKRNTHLRKYEKGEWDSQRPSKSVFDMFLSMGSEHIIWGGNYFTDYLFVSGKWLFWDKVQTMPSYSDGEMAWTSIAGDSVKQFTYNGSGLHAKEKDRVHPTQKPLALMKWCVDQCKLNPQTILDPFMGSGTTGVAAVQMGRSFIGIEREKQYFDIACERIEKAQLQTDMFIQPATKPEQATIAL